MKKDQFVNRLQNLNLREEEIERKWRLYLREKEESQIIYQTFKNMQSSPVQSPVTAGGGGTDSSTPTYTSAEMLIYVDTDDQWKMVVANFDNGTISEPINTGILYDGGSSSIYTRWPISHGKGFMIIFTNGPLSRTECFFVDSSGRLVDTIITAGGFNYGYEGGIMTWFADYEPDGEPTTEIIMKMFDGERVTTHILYGTSNINVNGLAGNLGVTVTLTRTAGATETYLLRWNATADLLFTHVVDTSYTIVCSHATEFVIVLDQEGTGDLYFIRARKWTGSSLTLEETSLSGFTVNNIQAYTTYGTSKFICIFYNQLDPVVGYLTYQTSLSGTNLDTHPNNGDYPFVSLLATQKQIWYPANVINEKAVVLFYSSGTASTVPNFSDYDYFSILYYTESGTSYGLNIADGTPMAVQYSDSNAGRGGVYAADPVFSIYDPADITNLEFTLLTDTGFTNITTDIDLTDLGNIEVSAVSPDYFLVQYNLSSQPTQNFLDLYSSNGRIEQATLSDTLSYDTPPVNRGGIVVIDEVDVTNSFVWGSSSLKVPPAGLTQNSIYQILGFPNVRNDFGTADALAPGYQVVLETLPETFQPTRFYIVSDTGWQGPFETEAGIGLSPDAAIQLGETVFHYLYQRFEDNIWVYNSYSLITGDLVNTYVTGYTSFNSFNEYGDRASIQINDGNGNWIFVYPTKRGTTETITVPQTSTSQSWNDAYWSYD